MADLTAEDVTGQWDFDIRVQLHLDFFSLPYSGIFLYQKQYNATIQWSNIQSADFSSPPVFLS